MEPSIRAGRLENVLTSCTDRVLESRGKLFEESQREVARLRELAKKMGLSHGKTAGRETADVTLATVLTKGHTDDEVLSMIKICVAEVRKLYPEDALIPPRPNPTPN